MTRILKSKIVKAKKAHYCDCCNQLIGENENYHYIVHLSDGDFVTTKLHLSCNNAVNKILYHWYKTGSEDYILDYGYTFAEVISEINSLLRDKGIDTHGLSDNELVKLYLETY